MRTAAICPTCATYENAICVLYDGPYLPCTGISPLDSIAEALAKIDAAICALGGTTTTSTSSTTSSTTSTTSTTTTAGPTTTTTTTTVSSCAAPVITDITTNGAYPQAAVTVYYDLNGIVDVLSVIISYSLDPDFGSGFNDTISNLNLTSYTVPDFTGSSTWYFRIRKVCGTDPQNPTGESYSNVVSIVPQPTTTTTTTAPTTTTTTTTSCIAGLTQQILITDVIESPGGTIDIFNTPIGEACALLPNIQAGSVPIIYSTFPERLDGQLFIGANIIYGGIPGDPRDCNPVLSGTYALYANPLSGVTTFIEVIDGVITDIVNCSTTTTTTTATPTTTTTTTTNCTTGLESHSFMTQINDSGGNPINILTTPIGDACALLPAIQTGGGYTAYTVYMDSLAVGQSVIYSFCTPLATGTYALADGSVGSINTFIAVVDGVITEILNCGTFVTFSVNIGTDQATACDPELSIPTYLFAASGPDISGNTLYVDTALTDLAQDVEFSYGPNYYTTNASGVVSFGGAC